MTFEAPRGTHDILPSEQPRWRHVLGEFERLCHLYGYRRIDTPVFEETDLFARTSGQGSDVVAKEMYTFEDRGDRSLTLRAEATAPIVRAYLEHGMASKGRIHRLWYMGPMFRYGRPQKGRYRQFWQIGAEVIGSAAPGADVEMIALFVDLFEAWGFRAMQDREELLDRRAVAVAWFEEEFLPVIELLRAAGLIAKGETDADAYTRLGGLRYRLWRTMDWSEEIIERLRAERRPRRR